MGIDWDSRQIDMDSLEQLRARHERVIEFLNKEIKRRMEEILHSSQVDDVTHGRHRRGVIEGLEMALYLLDRKENKEWYKHV